MLECEKGMTGEIIKQETFREIPIRIISSDGKQMIPLVDIAHGIDYEPGNLKKIYDRNSKLLEKYSQTCMITSGAQVAPVPHICLTRDGVNGILMRLDYHRIKNEDKKQKILNFLDWSIETLGKVMDGKIDEIQPFEQKPEQPSISLGNRVSDQLQIADAMAKYANVDRGIAVSMALSKVQFDTGTDLTMWKNLVVKGKPQKRVGVLLATEIGMMLGFGNNSGKSVNKILIGLGYLERFSGHPTLTEKGERHAEAFPVSGVTEDGKSWSRYDIRWQPEIVEILRKHLFMEMPKPEQGLLTGHI